MPPYISFLCGANDALYHCLQVLGRAKMWNEALQVKSDMLAAGVTPNVVTWTSIIGACAAAGLVEQSFREFDKMVNAGCHPNVNCYNMLLHGCVKVVTLSFLPESRILFPYDCLSYPSWRRSAMW